MLATISFYYGAIYVQAGNSTHRTKKNFKSWIERNRLRLELQWRKQANSIVNVHRKRKSCRQNNYIDNMKCSHYQNPGSTSLPRGDMMYRDITHYLKNRSEIIYSPRSLSHTNKLVALVNVVRDPTFCSKFQLPSVLKVSFSAHHYSYQYHLVRIPDLQPSKSLLFLRLFCMITLSTFANTLFKL